jgi:hypothetical protein
MQKLTWKNAVSTSVIRIKLIAGLALLAALFLIFPVFFQYIQQRQGPVLYDFVLNNIPAVNLSVPLFMCIWIPGLLMAYRAVKSPSIFITFLWSFLFLSGFRLSTITLCNFNPPRGLVALTDPLLSRFYGNSTVTKDLMFSGHTATIFLIYLCLEKQSDRLVALTASILVGIFVLIQHIHYTVDVVFAIPFALLAWFLGIKAAGLKKCTVLKT